MKTLDKIVEISKDDINRFNKLLLKEAYSNDKNLNIILDYVFKDKGKLIRPYLVYLSARIFDDVKEDTDYAAFMVQILHTSTLMHDDVVDEASIRRGKPTVNAAWKNKLAILVGDYLFARALSVATHNKLFEILNILSPTIEELSIGEINQMEIAGTRHFSEEKYYEIIQRKTAVLISACTECGAVSVGVNGYEREMMKELGMAAGMAFQIQDDILDFTAGGIFGKAKGKDLEEKKYTLPLIYALQEAPTSESDKIIKMIEKGVKRKQINEVISFIEKYKGIEYAQECMNKQISNAEEILSELPQNEANQALKDLIHYFTVREK